MSASSVQGETAKLVFPLVHLREGKKKKDKLQESCALRVIKLQVALRSWDGFYHTAPLHFENIIYSAYIVMPEASKTRG